MIGPTRMWNRKDAAAVARSFRRHPWRFSLVPAPFLGYGAWGISGSWLRGVIVAVAVVLVLRFGLGPYIVRLNSNKPSER